MAIDACTTAGRTLLVAGAFFAVLGLLVLLFALAILRRVRDRAKEHEERLDRAGAYALAERLSARSAPREGIAAEGDVPPPPAR